MSKKGIVIGSFLLLGFWICVVNQQLQQQQPAPAAAATTTTADKNEFSKKLHSRLTTVAKESENKSCEDYMKDLEKELEAIASFHGKCEGIVSRPPKKCDAMLEQQLDSKYFEYSVFGNMETQKPILPLRLLIRCK